MGVKITFRPTPRQILGRTLFIGVLAGGVALLPAVAAMAFNRSWNFPVLGGITVAVLGVATLVAVRGARHLGVMVDDQGIHPIEPRQARQGHYAHWTRIVDIRAERRGHRTVPVVYLRDPNTAPWRLRAPYSGRAMGADTELGEKIFVMRTFWETYRNGPQPGARGSESGFSG